MAFYIPPVSNQPSRPSSRATTPLPRRTDSMPRTANSLPPVFAATDDDLRDARRVKTHGQEEDLRFALERIIKRVEELSSLLKDAYRQQTELETNLKLAKSNLQVALLNNEMLEDALKHDGSGRGKDVGWHRLSARDLAAEKLKEEERVRPRTPGETPTSPDAGGPGSPEEPNTPNTPATQVAEGTLINRLFTSSRPPSRQNSFSGRPNVLQKQHLASASMPSLLPDNAKQLEELGAQVEKEKTAAKKAREEKRQLEEELESLSQALFEEANKMVAVERMRRSEMEEELREARQEKDALKSAMRVIEAENGRLRNQEGDDNYSAHSRSSSVAALKSPAAEAAPFPSSNRASLDMPATSALSAIPPTDPSDPSLSGDAGSVSAVDGGFFPPPPKVQVEAEPSPWADAFSMSPRVAAALSSQQSSSKPMTSDTDDDDDASSRRSSVSSKHSASSTSAFRKSLADRRSSYLGSLGSLPSPSLRGIGNLASPTLEYARGSLENLRKNLADSELFTPPPDDVRQASFPQAPRLAAAFPRSRPSSRPGTPGVDRVARMQLGSADSATPTALPRQALVLNGPDDAQAEMTPTASTPSPIAQ